MELVGQLVVAPLCAVVSWFGVVYEKVAGVGQGACEEGGLVESFASAH